MTSGLDVEEGLVVVEGGVEVAAAFGVGGEGEALFEARQEALLDEELFDGAVDDEIFGEGGVLAADVGAEGLGDGVGEEGGDLFHGWNVPIGLSLSQF
jgi:hypothetical protein